MSAMSSFFEVKADKDTNLKNRRKRWLTFSSRSEGFLDVNGSLVRTRVKCYEEDDE